MSPRKNNNPISEFLAELMRRRVLHIGGAYIAGAWLGAEILNFLFEQFQAPVWSYRLLAIVFVVGFPISMVLAWIIQVQEDGSWVVDPSRGEHKTVAVAIVLGLLITAGLSWLIIPQRIPELPYEPMPNSLAVLPITYAVGTPNGQVVDTLYLALMEGLEQSADLTLVRLGPGEQPQDLQEYGQSLGVAAVSAGQFTYTPEGDVIEILLLDVELGNELWSQSFDWDPTRIIETGTAVANGLLQAMSLPALSQEKFTGTDQIQAYEAFLSGKHHAAAWSASSQGLAVDDFQQAIDLDPGYVQAHLGLAQSIYDLIELSQPPEAEQEALKERAHSAVGIAQRLEPESADAMSLLGLVQENRQMRVVAFERALELDPGHDITYYHYAAQMSADGELEEAERLINRAIVLRPMSARYRLELADILIALGREEEAQAELEKAATFQL